MQLGSSTFITNDTTTQPNRIRRGAENGALENLDAAAWLIVRCVVLTHLQLLSTLVTLWNACILATVCTSTLCSTHCCRYAIEHLRVAAGGNWGAERNYPNPAYASARVWCAFKRLCESYRSKRFCGDRCWLRNAGMSGRLNGTRDLRELRGDMVTKIDQQCFRTRSVRNGWRERQTWQPNYKR